MFADFIILFIGGGKHGMGFVVNFLENTTVREFRKSANICQLKLWTNV